MLCKVFAMDQTMYMNVPRSGLYSPRNQPKGTTMYRSWKEPEQVDNIQPKLSGSWTNLREIFSENEGGFDQQLNKQKSSREFGSDLKEDKGMRETEEEALERPQFQVTFEKPVSSNWRHARRASDGSIVAPNLSGRVLRTFGVLAEETTSQVSANRSNTEPLSTTPLARNRRASVDYLRPSITNQSRQVKVSIVNPQPRNKENSDLTQIKSNENLSSISCDSEDTSSAASWRELVAKAKGFRPASRSGETSIDRRANGGGLLATVPARRANAPTLTDQLDGGKLSFDCKAATNRRSSDNEYLDSAKTNTTVVPIPISSGFECERSSAVLKESLSDGESIKRGELEANDARKKTRRYSVATVRPAANRLGARPSGQKVSGYSTHSTLEYARQLLGKLQTEGRNKSKKERLDQLSKALKWILEELNRIEVPDKDLVSLFVSLRAQIVNLKAEVKAEERDVSTAADLERMGRMSQMLTTSDKPRNVYSRRFSWC